MRSVPEKKAAQRKQEDVSAKELLLKSDFDSRRVVTGKCEQHARINYQSVMLIDVLFDLPPSLIKSVADLGDKAVLDRLATAPFKKPINLMMLNVCLQQGASPFVLPDVAWQRLYGVSLSQLSSVKTFSLMAPPSKKLGDVDHDVHAAAVFLLQRHMRLQAVEFVSLLKPVVDLLLQCNSKYLNGFFAPRSRLAEFVSVIDVVADNCGDDRVDSFEKIRMAIETLRVLSIDEASFFSTYDGMQPMPSGSDTPREIKYIRYLLKNIKAFDLSQLRRRDPVQEADHIKCMADIYVACKDAHAKAFSPSLTARHLSSSRI